MKFISTDMLYLNIVIHNMRFGNLTQRSTEKCLIEIWMFIVLEFVVVHPD
jgi:hypothetical protein